jgi:hypothetical protein
MTRARFAVIVVLSHLAAATLHGAAHGVLRVSAGGAVGVLVVAAAVYVGPLLALVALHRGRRVTAGVVLSISMSAALVYGLTFHYLLHTPDHVLFAPAGPWGDVFGASAAVIAVLEACGLATGLLLTAPNPRRVLP